MNAVRFFAEVGTERQIRLPEEVHLEPGRVEVIVLQPERPLPSADKSRGRPLRDVIQRLGNLAEDLGIDMSHLPPDLAENHDHYLHGLPKGIDRQ